MSGPLSGYRIIDATQMVSGPMAVMILGDQGADVIKVEPIKTGDLTRTLGGRRAGISPVFATTNRNKRSLAVDLKTDPGREILERLTVCSDVFVENFRPGTVERLKIDYRSLQRIKPDLIYVSINGFGEKGPYAHKRVYDPIIQAISGLADIQADRSTGRPRMMRLIVPDKVTALTAAQAITAALLHHERTGKGQHVRLSMLDAVVSFLWPEAMAEYTMLDIDKQRERPLQTRDLIFETTDGYITVGALSDVEWSALTRVLGHPEWQSDARFKSPAGRIRQTRHATRFEGSPAELRRPAPRLGEHSSEILEELGYTDGQIAALSQSRVVASPQ